MIRTNHTTTKTFFSSQRQITQQQNHYYRYFSKTNQTILQRKHGKVLCVNCLLANQCYVQYMSENVRSFQERRDSVDCSAKPRPTYKQPAHFAAHQNQPLPKCQECFRTWFTFYKRHFTVFSLQCNFVLGKQ